MSAPGKAEAPASVVPDPAMAAELDQAARLDDGQLAGLIAIDAANVAGRPIMGTDATVINGVLHAPIRAEQQGAPLDDPRLALLYELGSRIMSRAAEQFGYEIDFTLKPLGESSNGQ